MQHHLISEDDGVSCVVCGAFYFDADAPRGHCTGRTDLVHGNDDVSTSHHSLDDCEDYDHGGSCKHLAAPLGCDCDRCR